MPDTADTFEIRVVASPEEMNVARAIREEVFVREQACAPEEEWDAFDEISRHFVGYAGGSPVAVARWRTTLHNGRSVAKLERFAVRAPYRGRGYGRRMVESLIQDAARAGFSTCFIHAQAHLESYYQAFGFRTIGGRFMEAGIPHVPMLREASDARTART